MRPVEMGGNVKAEKEVGCHDSHTARGIEAARPCYKSVGGSQDELGSDRLRANGLCRDLQKSSDSGTMIREAGIDDVRFILLVLEETVTGSPTMTCGRHCVEMWFWQAPSSMIGPS
jgi:hypothetical protein